MNREREGGPLDPAWPARRAWLRRALAGAIGGAVAGAGGVSLVGCGFQPRAPLVLPGEASGSAEGRAIRISGLSRDQTFAQALTRALAGVGLRAVFAGDSRPEAASGFVLRTAPVQFDRRELRVAAGSRVSEIEWSGRVDARLEGLPATDAAEGGEAVAARDAEAGVIVLGPLRARRRYSFVPELVLAQGERDVRLQRAIEQELADALVRRLTLELGERAQLSRSAESGRRAGDGRA